MSKLALLFSCALLLGSAAVRADVPPPSCGTAADNAPCAGKQTGDACTFANGTKGNCAALRCTNDAGQTLHQCVATGGTPPSTGCSAAPGGAGAGAGGAVLALLGALGLRRRRRG